MQNIDRVKPLMEERIAFNDACPIASCRSLVLCGFFAAISLSACGTDSSDVHPAATRGDLAPDNSASWPSGEGDEVGVFFMKDFPDAEPSGIAYDSRSSSTFVVSDDGRLFELAEDGSVSGNWDIGGDPEGLALDPLANILYVADEEGSMVELFDLSTHAFAPGAFCTLNIPVSGDKGLEAIAFVPAGEAPERWGENPSGFIVAGTQASSTLYVYPSDACNGGEVIEPLDLGAHALESTNDDVSGLVFDARLGVFLVLHDKKENTLDVVDLNGSVLSTYVLPGKHPEGVSISNVDCVSGFADVDIAYDDGGVIRFSDFPISCVEDSQ